MKREFCAYTVDADILDDSLLWMDRMAFQSCMGECLYWSDVRREAHYVDGGKKVRIGWYVEVDT